MPKTVAHTQTHRHTHLKSMKFMVFDEKVRFMTVCVYVWERLTFLFWQ